MSCGGGVLDALNADLLISYFRGEGSVWWDADEWWPVGGFKNMINFADVILERSLSSNIKRDLLVLWKYYYFLKVCIFDSCQTVVKAQK